MDLFKVLAILSVLLVVVTAQDVDCGDIAVNDAMMKCATDAGIPVSDIMRFMPSNGMINITEEDYLKQCAYQDQYINASTCFTNVFKSCFPDDMDYMPDVHQISSMMDIMCNDTNFNISCLVAMNEDLTAIQACVKSKDDYSPNSTTSLQEDICKSARAGTQCAVESIRKCDERTASTFERMQTMALPSYCNASPVVG